MADFAAVFRFFAAGAVRFRFGGVAAATFSAALSMPKTSANAASSSTFALAGGFLVLTGNAATRTGPVRMQKILGLARLAPDIVEAFARGRQPVGPSPLFFAGNPLPDEWNAQRDVIGGLAPRSPAIDRSPPEAVLGTVLDSTLTCPVCGRVTTERMPTDACPDLAEGRASTGAVPAKGKAPWNQALRGFGGGASFTAKVPAVGAIEHFCGLLRLAGRSGVSACATAGVRCRSALPEDGYRSVRKRLTTADTCLTLPCATSPLPCCRRLINASASPFWRDAVKAESSPR